MADKIEGKATQMKAHLHHRTMDLEYCQINSKKYLYPNSQAAALEDIQRDKDRVGEGFVPMETSIIVEEMMDDGMASCMIM